MMKVASAVTLLVLQLVVLRTAHGTADPSALISFANMLMAANDNILGAAVAGVDASGARSDVTVATGYSTAATQRMRPSTAVRGGTIGEMLQDAVVLQLIASGTLTALDESIPTQWLPGGLTFVNPNYPGIPLTLRMLMTHTSTLTDVTSRLYAPPALVSGNATDLVTFANYYFLTSASGVVAVQSDIWTTAQPGLASSYNYAVSNIALLMYVVQLMLTENPTLTTVQTVGSLVQQNLMAAIGMDNTYTLLPNGQVPYTYQALPTLTANKQTDPVTFENFAAYLANYMTLTNAADLARYAYYVLVVSTTSSSSLAAVGTAMLSPSNFYTLDNIDLSRGGVSAQGLGLVQFDAATLCGYWTAAGASSSSTCPFSSTTATLYGYSNVNEAATLAVLCEILPPTSVVQGTAAPSNSLTCVSATLARSSPTVGGSTTGTVPVSDVMALLTEAFNQLSSSTLNTDSSVPIITPDDQREGSIYGLSVFGIIVGVILGVFFLAYIVEFIIRPMALAGPVVSRAYPRLETVMDEEDETSPLQLSSARR